MSDPLEQDLPEGEEAPPPYVRAMAVVRWLLVIAMALFAGYTLARHYGLFVENAEGAATYQCPMHPAVVQDHPGDCPICGMALVVAKPKSGDNHAHEGVFYCPMHPEVVSSDPNATCDKCGGMKLVPKPRAEGPELALGDRAQRMGITTAKVEVRAPLPEVSIWGVVTARDGRVSRVHARASGYVESLFVKEPGNLVQKGQPLFTFYSPELVAAQRELLTAERWAKDGRGPHGMAETDLAAAARDKLRTLGVTDADMDDLTRKGEAMHALTVRAPQAGYVSSKPIVQGSYVEAGALLVELTDLSEVWLEAELPQNLLPRVQKGLNVTVRVPGEATERKGTVGLVLPSLDVNQRTAKLRVGLSNRDLALRVGTSAEVKLNLLAEPGLYMPDRAVLDTGREQLVFVAREGGRFEKRKVTLGARVNELVEVLAGLREGDAVVTSAAFLLDAETRLSSEGAP